MLGCYSCIMLTLECVKQHSMAYVRHFFLSKLEQKAFMVLKSSVSVTIFSDLHRVD